MLKEKQKSVHPAPPWDLYSPVGWFSSRWRVTASLVHPALLHLFFLSNKKGDFFLPSSPPRGCTAPSLSAPARQESLIELVPGPVAAASAKRQTDPAWRLSRGSVKSALLQNSPRASLFLPSSQRHLRRKKAPACQAAMNRTACAECKRGGCTSPSSPPSSRGKKRGGGEGRGVDGGGEEKAADAAFRMQQLYSAACERGFSGLKRVWWIRLHARRSRQRQELLSLSRSQTEKGLLIKHKKKGV